MEKSGRYLSAGMICPLFFTRRILDLAMIPINPLIDQLTKQKIRISYRNIDASIIPGDSAMNTMNVSEDLMMIGHPSGIRPEFNGVPFVKKGVSTTPIFLDYNNRKEFLADIPVFDGSVGAPVIVYQVNYNDRFDQRTIGQRLFLIGINYAALSNGYREKIIPRSSHRLSGSEEDQKEELFNTAIIIKSQKILDFTKVLESLKK